MAPARSLKEIMVDQNQNSINTEGNQASAPIAEIPTIASFQFQASFWQSFHRINAVLRVVSRRANLSDLQRMK
jgi:hypothetical protein